MDYQYGQDPQNNTNNSQQTENTNPYQQDVNTNAQNGSAQADQNTNSSAQNGYTQNGYSQSGYGSTSSGYGHYGNGNTSYNNSGSTWNDEWENPSNRQNGYNNYGASSGQNNRPNRNNHHNRGWVAALMAGVLVIGVAAGAMFGSGMMTATDNQVAQATVEADAETEAAESAESKTALTQSSESAKEVETTATTTASGTALTVQEIAQNCLPSIVAITNKSETEIRSMWGETYTQESDSAGSGVIIGETDTELLIVTNYHVIENNESLSVLFSYQESISEDEQDIVTALVKDYDSSKDLAVIAIQKDDLSDETLANIKVATIGDSDELQLGEQVVAIGNALGYGQSVTTGIVSAMHRTIELTQDDGTEVTNEYLQTDAAINPGNSGGGLFNMYGELVGINSAKVSLEEVEGMGYSIPISDVTADIETMMNAETKMVVAEENRGYLGIQGSNVTSDINQTYGIPEGVYISNVIENSPAEKAGLQKGMVITGLNGKTVTNFDTLKDLLSYYAAGETITITVQVQSNGGYQEKQIHVLLGTEEEAGIASSESSTGNNSSQSSGNGYQETPYGNFYDFFGGN